MTQKIIVRPSDAAFARAELLAWFKTSARSFPWRYDSNSYHVLMAELMLRRTQARQVPAVYMSFLEKYPDIYSLYNASQEEVNEVLYPLGLRWRASNFKELAKAVVENHQSRIPRERNELLELPGVGPYVADAVRCFAFGEHSTLADTNTVRVAARYFGFSYDAESRRNKAVVNAVAQLVDIDNPIDSNYALLDFAALICQARNPIHDLCPLASRCAYVKKPRVTA